METFAVNLLLLGSLQLTNLKFTVSYETSTEEAILPTPVLPQSSSFKASNFSTNTENVKPSINLPSISSSPTMSMSNDAPFTTREVISTVNNWETTATTPAYLNHSDLQTPSLSDEYLTTITFSQVRNLSIMSGNEIVLLLSGSGENQSNENQFNISLTSNYFTQQSTVFTNSLSQTVNPTKSVEVDSTPFFILPKLKPTMHEFQEHEIRKNISNGTSMQLLLIFEGRCIHDQTNTYFDENDFQDLIKNATGLTNVNLAVLGGLDICKKEKFEIPLTVIMNENEKYVFTRLNSLIGKFNLSMESNNKTNILTLIDIEFFTTHHKKNSFFVDFLPYIIIGGVFGGILIIVMLLICSKCLCTCRSKSSKKQPDYEFPHLSLRPEDYNLTRIPRPTTIYTENMASPIMNDEGSLSSGPYYNGEHSHRQSFETSIVPIEEIMRVDDPYLRYKLHEYHQDDNNSETQTFYRKILHHRSTETDDGIVYRQPDNFGSTDRLHKFSRDMAGSDNQAYFKN